MGTVKNGVEVDDRINGEVVTKHLEKVSTTSRVDGGGEAVTFERTIVTVTKGPAASDSTK